MPLPIVVFLASATPILPLLLTAIVALIPGAYSWWTGRALLARVDDPAFPELLLARGQRRVQIGAAAAALTLWIPGSHRLWAFPLFVIALLVGGFPFRRTLYGETWSVASYLRFTLFAFVGMAGFWLTLASTPFLVFSIADRWTAAASAQSATIVAATIAVLLVIWDYVYPLLWLALNRASLLQRADLQQRFGEIIKRSSVSDRPPQVFRFGARGGYMMNAFALPSLRQHRVAFGDTLLELLSPDEIVAVFAHEVAHLEHFDRRRMLRLRIITYLLILGASAIPPVLLAIAPAHAWTVKLVWPIVVLTVLALRVSKSQAHETESDLRAGVLTGDPEAMVRALTKLHHYSRMPRRWPYDFERAASHPSLAHRIQALRTQGTAATAVPPARLGVATLLHSTEPGVYAALDDKRAYWFDGLPADVTPDSIGYLLERSTSYRAVAYTDLTELRVAVGRGGRRTLLARDTTGKSWSMPLRADDVSAAQQALDVLDVQLGNHTREDWRTKARICATLLALAFVGALDFSWPWIPLLVTLAKPSKASVSAMGSMAIGRVLLAAITGSLGVAALGGSWPAAWISVIAMFGIGVWACRLAWRWTRGDERPTSPPFTIMMLAILSVLLVGALAITTNYGSANSAALSLPASGPAQSAAVLVLGFGAVLLTYGDRLRRRSGAALAVLAIALGAFGIDGQRLFSRINASRITWTTAHADVAERVDLSSSAYRLHLSPGGHRFAIQGTGRRPARYEDEGNDETVSLWEFTIASTKGSRRTLEAFDIAFVDDERVLVLRAASTSGDSLELSLERAEGSDSAAIWRRMLPANYAPTLALDRTSGTWRVSGHDVHSGTAVTSAGRIGSDSVGVTRFAAGPLTGRPLHTYRDGTTLIATLHGSYGMRQMLLAMLGFYPFRWDVWHIANGQRRSRGSLPGIPECGGRDESVTCVVRGRSGITLWQLGASTVSPTPLGPLPTGLDLWDIAADGQVAAASRDASTLAIVDAGARRGTRIALGGGVELQGAPAGSTSLTTDVAVGPGVVATLVVRGAKSEVTFYRVR